MDYIHELGTKALASRLKNFTELMIRDVSRIYKEQDLDFEPRWFTFFLLLSEKGELSVMDIANQLNQSHPAINQVANALEEKGLITSNKKKHDGRKRYLKLSPKGNRLLQKLLPLWKDIQKITDEFIQETNPEFMENLLKMEQSLSKTSIYNRINSQLKKTQYEQVNIIPFSSELKDFFKSLNYEWLNKYFSVEKSDEDTLSKPETIIKNGGNIYFAQMDNRIVGTVAILHHQSNICELSKMAVTKSFQGKQAGRKLLDSAIDFAQQKNYQKIILFSNPELKKAIELYESFGFKHCDNTENIQYNYERCTIQMELDLTYNN